MDSKISKLIGEIAEHVAENDLAEITYEEGDLKVKVVGKQTQQLVSIDDTIMHTGFTGTSLWMDRKNNVGLCILTNRVHPKRGNGLHMEYRARIANFVMAHLNELRKELKEHANN